MQEPEWVWDEAVVWGEEYVNIYRLGFWDSP